MNDFEKTRNLRMTTISLLTRHMDKPTERRLQLASYILQEELNVPTKNLLRIQYYEPFSRETENTIDTMNDMGFIRKTYVEGAGRTYQAIEELPRDIMQSAARHIPTIMALANQVAGFNDLEMAVAATACFLKRKYSQNTEDKVNLAVHQMKNRVSPGQVRTIRNNMKHALVRARQQAEEIRETIRARREAVAIKSTPQASPIPVAA